MIIYEGRIVYDVVREFKISALNEPEDMAAYLKDAFNAHPLQEQFIVVPLNRKNKPYGRFSVSLGSAFSAFADPREVFRPAILAGASSIAVGHNHPSGDPTPSSADHTLTRKIRDAGNILSIGLLDHVIIGNQSDDPRGNGYYSFSENGII